MTHDTAAQLRSAMTVLALLMEQDAAGEVLDKQRAHCRALRAMLNETCPDGSLDAYEGNIVEQV